jgi:23S rRNA pseudouridine2604 synthase
VTINRNVARLGNRVNPGDRVRVDGQPLDDRPETLYLAYNKPIGIVSTTDPQEKLNIIKSINYPERLFPIGRLDKDSEGLILLTNDGDIVNKILRVGNKHEKEYVVTVNQPIKESFIERMKNGVEILDTKTRKCEVTQVSSHIFHIVLTQGLNRQIRRMCEKLDYEVTKLKRIRIMNVKLGKLPVGEWRELTQEETINILSSVKSSSKTKKAPAQKNKRVGKTKARKSFKPRKTDKPVKAGKPEKRTGTARTGKSRKGK